MKTDYLVAYEFYKRQYPNSVILFHIGMGYYAFEDDAYVVADIAESPASYSRIAGCIVCDFLQYELEAMCDKLRNIAEFPVTVVEYRDSQGSFVIPKVKQILQDMEDDY